MDLPTWRLRRSGSPWQQVAPLVRLTVFPAPEVRVQELPQRVPRKLGHLFWNADLSKVDLRRDARYVASRWPASVTFWL